MQHRIFIAGAGGIGRAAGLLLAQYDKADYSVTLGDISADAIDEATTFVSEGNTRGKQASGFAMSTDGDDTVLSHYLADCDVLLDCLPGSQAPRMARLAKASNCHYANLTEYVAETEEIMEIARGADTAFVLQTGLAPGFINVLAMQLLQRFKARHRVTKVDKVAMKVGALSQHVSGPHFYAFTWSPVGVATEYLKDAVVVRDGVTITVPALSGVETHIIDRELYEDNFTSGGAADLPVALAGQVRNLEYKTLRYKGHYDWVRQQLDSIPAGDQRIKRLQDTMLSVIPMVEDDIVVVYASVTGRDHQGVLRKEEKSYKVLPSKVGNVTLRAIQSTTAAPLCEVAHMMIQGRWSGLVLQSEMDPDTFINGDFVSAVYGGC